MELYPLKFTPILKEKIWGGSKLTSVLGKDSQSEQLGESWEISDVEGDTSIICNGMYRGKSLKWLLEQSPKDILGEKNAKTFGTKFPLLIKFIDAREDLSIQLHPNDELASKRHNSFGKTEMWYVMQADKGANLIVGFNQDMNVETYLEHLENKTLPEILSFEPVNAGDTFFIEVGRVHAIGAGVLLAEIQQTSDITYRVYDWDRVDDEGNARELHNDLAIDAIDFNMPNNYKVGYDQSENQPNQMVSCPYFTTNYINLNTVLQKENHNDSFMIYMCVEGEADIIYNNQGIQIKAGETLLLPAILKTYQISAKRAKLLEVYV
ncbi:mannose-6-phosphate isomerase [Paucihalobacter ruber]|uniref:Phosphohexomutase n=1 Tax=Paucihalobacter ruber TaxID=2567861 RepID=A0A506PTF3_9FLAO|nr:type I phosphomannose isomerase catalytic subunit [Paucihalobacter ruber]TPV35500.1 mannose-6-phosphate isomerase [Paucihalobacter ruber]